MTDNTADSITDNELFSDTEAAATTADSERKPSKSSKKTSAAKSTKAKQAPAQAASSLTDDEKDEIANLPYEEARDRLIQAVQTLEAGGLSLDKSMRQWEVGEALAKRAQSLLADVRAKLDQAQSEQESTAGTAGTQSNLE